MRPLKTYSTLDLSTCPLNEISPRRVLEQIAPVGGVAFERVVMTRRQVSELKMQLNNFGKSEAPMGDTPLMTRPAYEQPPVGAIGRVAGAWLVERLV